MYYIYVLLSLKDRKLYIGFTSDLRTRYRNHQSGYVTSTKEHRPLELIYYEAYQSEFEARRRERYLKGGNGRSELKRQLNTTLTKYHYRFRADA